MCAEFDRRLASAWRRFWQLWPMLGNTSSHISQRLRLLDTCVAGVLLWCNGSWTLTQRQRRRLRTTQTDMMRKIACVRRAPEEDGLAWFRRATGIARAAAAKAKIGSWLRRHLNAKWAWAGHVARMEHNRWAKKLTFWRAELAGVAQWQRPVRARAGAFGRWEKDLQKYCSDSGHGHWRSFAQSRDHWQTAAAAFCEAYML